MIIRCGCSTADAIGVADDARSLAESHPELTGATTGVAGLPLAEEALGEQMFVSWLATVCVLPAAANYVRAPTRALAAPVDLASQP